MTVDKSAKCDHSLFPDIVNDVGVGIGIGLCVTRQSALPTTCLTERNDRRENPEVNTDYFISCVLSQQCYQLDFSLHYIEKNTCLMYNLEDRRWKYPVCAQFTGCKE